MKGNIARFFCFLVYAFTTLHVHAAITPKIYPDAPTRQFLFIENNRDGNFFVTPSAERTPIMTGANRWTSAKYDGTGVTNYSQVSLGYIDNGYNTQLHANWKFDMWLENSPTSYPLTGLSCINWNPGCDMATSLIPPETTDDQGFYGVNSGEGTIKSMHGMMSDQFYQFLNTLPVGSTFSTTINGCQTPESYNPSAGERCKDMNYGEWYVRTVSFTKGAHMRLENTNSLSEVFIDSDGQPTLGEGTTGCNIQVINSQSGLACEMMTYTITGTSINNSSIKIFPTLNNAALASAIKFGDMQFSLDGKNWKMVSSDAYYFTFDEMRGAKYIYLFLSNNFFKQMVNLGIADTNTRDMFSFQLHNTVTSLTSWYAFSTSRELIVKPRDFSISIVSTDFAANPHKTGDVGSENEALEFEYYVTTSGKSSADEVKINVTGPTQNISGRPWCIFSSPDGSTQVPFPALLTYTTSNGATKQYDVGCDGQWRDMTDAQWTHTPWTDSHGNGGIMDRSTVKLSIGLDSPESLNTINNDMWYGEVSASGEINVQATWRNVP